VSDLNVLWQPIQLGGLTVENRIFVCAHETYFAGNKALTEQYVAYLEERARGGAGVVMIGASGVHPRGAANAHMQAWHPENVPMYKSLSSRVHEHGSRVFVQLFHAGHQTNGQVGFDWEPPLAPSAITGPNYDRVPEPMDAADIATVVRAFGDAAALAQEGGLDGVELSGGHGYLIGQFLSPMSNKRTDGYGGTLENRCRLAIEIGTEIRRRCGSLPLGIRLSYDEYLGAAGITPDEADQTTAILHAAGLFDYFNISGVNYHSVQNLVSTMSSGLHEHMVVNAARAKAIVGGDVPVLTANAIRSVERAADIVARGDADMVGMTRAHIADPEIVRKARAGKVGEIRRCVAANQGCVRRGGMGKGITCTVNPAVGREALWGLAHGEVAETPLRVLVVGGGPAGMKAAESAALRGHDVTLMERDGALGGSLRLAAQLPTRDEWLHLIEDLAGSLERLGVDVRLNCEADVAAVAELDPDATVVATGAVFEPGGFSTTRPDRAGIPGAELAHVIDPVAALTDPGTVGDRVVIVDDHGDQVAFGVALTLAEAGRSVELVTPQLFAGMATAATLDLPWLYPRLVAAGVRLTPQSFVDRITPASVTIASMWGGEPRDAAADTVILNMGRVPRAELFETLRDAGRTVQRIGDARVPREVDDAIYEGERWGRTVAVTTAAAGAGAAAV
jgi:2,4-dienoyl-CoA reductase-like NADH-dependent reductase (Old Yellow Enzyme family)/thioredoxin reductase